MLGPSVIKVKATSVKVVKYVVSVSCSIPTSRSPLIMRVCGPGGSVNVPGGAGNIFNEELAVTSVDCLLSSPAPFLEVNAPKKASHLEALSFISEVVWKEKGSPMKTEEVLS